MKPVKRIEIVVESQVVPQVLVALAQAGAPNWSVVRDVAGKGERGLRAGDELTDVFRNTYVLVACDPAVVQAVVDGVRPILRTFGGMCLVSDASWVVH